MPLAVVVPPAPTRLTKSVKATTEIPGTGFLVFASTKVNWMPVASPAAATVTLDSTVSTGMRINSYVTSGMARTPGSDTRSAAMSEEPISTSFGPSSSMECRTFMTVLRGPPAPVDSALSRRFAAATKAGDTALTRVMSSEVNPRTGIRMNRAV